MLAGAVCIVLFLWFANFLREILLTSSFSECFSISYVWIFIDSKVLAVVRDLLSVSCEFWKLYLCTVYGNNRISRFAQGVERNTDPVFRLLFGSFSGIRMLCISDSLVA